MAARTASIRTIMFHTRQNIFNIFICDAKLYQRSLNCKKTNKKKQRYRVHDGPAMGGASLVSGAASKPAALCVSGAARKPRGERDSRRRFFSSCSQRYVAPAFPPPLPPPSGTGERPLLEDEGRPPPAPLARHMAWNGHLFCPVELV